MRAWRVHSLGEPADVLRLESGVPAPVPGPGEVLVRVEAAALNYPDVLLCQGRYQERPPLPLTPGFEVAGVVAATGAGAEQAADPRTGEGSRDQQTGTPPVGRRVVATGAAADVPVGRRVAGMCTFPHGGLAEFTVLPGAAALPVPDDLPAVDAAAMVITHGTAHAALHRRARLRPGETLLVHAAAGGVGSATVRLGKAAGATVIATAGGPAKVEVCRRLGADHVIDYRAGDFVAPVLELTGGRGADVVVDPVGGAVFDRSRKVVAFEGRLVVIGFAGGAPASAPTNHALVKNYSVVGVHWGLYRHRLPHVVAETHEELMRLGVRPLVSEVLTMDQVPDGLARIYGRGTVGKLVVTVP